MLRLDLPADAPGRRRVRLLACKARELVAERLRQRLFSGLQRPDLVERHMQAPQQADAQKRLRVLLSVVAVAVLQPRRGEQPLPLIKANVGAVHAAARLHLANGHKNASFFVLFSR